MARGRESRRLVERHDDVGKHPIMGRKARFACIGPTRELHDASGGSAARIRLSWFDDVESIPVDEECVVPKSVTEFVRYGMFARNRLGVELRQRSVDAFRRQFHAAFL